MYVVNNNLTGVVYDQSRSTDMKGAIVTYVVKCVLCDEYTVEEFNIAVMGFMTNDDLGVISL